MRVVTRTTVRTCLEEVVRTARKELILISPYVDLWGSLQREILDAKVRGVKVIVVARGGKDRKKQEEATAKLRSMKIPVLFLDRLHAKLYANESTAILSSMNLLRSSQEASWEVSAVVDRATDPDGYKQVWDAIMEILLGHKAQQERVRFETRLASGGKTPAPGSFAEMILGPTRKKRTIQTPAPVRKAKAKAKAKAAQCASTPPKGQCIRCASAIPFKPAKPMCASCYKTWAKFADEDYAEKVCHGCGKKGGTSMKKPLCRPCWKAAG